MKLRAQLAKIGVPESGQAIPRIPSGFHSAPKSLRAIMKAMNDPQVGAWTKISEGNYNNKDWTEECQGVTHNGADWFISSNRDTVTGSAKRGIYRFSTSMEKLGFFGVDFMGYDHIGDIDCYNGRIYAAMEWPHEIFWMDTAFANHGHAPLRGSAAGSDPPQGKSLPWCAVNPWNGYLYSSKFGDADAPGVTEIFAYDPADSFKHKATLTLSTPSKRIQGGCFSDNGHLLLASDHSNDIRCYSVLNGKYLGSAAIQVGSGEEVEGITIRKRVSMHGKLSDVHVILLDNDWPSADDVYFKHYSVPVAADL